MSLLGIVLGLVLLMLLAYKGYSIIWVAPVCAVVVAILGGYSILGAYVGDYMKGMADYVFQWFPAFFLGAVYGKVMDLTGSARSLGNALVKLIGPRFAVAAVVIPCLLMTYGGISLFVVVFVIYPMGYSIYRAADLPRTLLPGAIGGLAGLLVASKSSRKLLAKYGTSALLAGGGAVAGTVLWNKYQQKMRAQNTSAQAPETAAAPTDVDPRSVRLITALVFAAKSDGHIDDHERANIETQLRAANIDVQARVLIDQALAQPLDPQRLAEGIIDPQEALEIYYVSCAVIDIDHFMERSYLNALGDALALPKDVRADIEQDIQSQKQALSV